MKLFSCYKNLLAAAFLYCFSLQGCSQVPSAKESAVSDVSYTDGKIKGLSFVASPRLVSEQEILKVSGVNANWVTLMPYGFVRSIDSPQVQYNNQRQWKGERIDGIKEVANLFRKQGIKVMIKPQLWMGHGSFTGHLEMKTEAAWKMFEDGYKKYILDFAKAAEETGCEMLCIGTELNNFIKARPVFWDTLISQVKRVYRGKLTYAENWDSFDKVPFWPQLDYIGIDAYFPLSDEEKFTVKALERGWEKHKKQITFISGKVGKPVLFTEYGYRSSLFAAKEPWAELNNEVCLENQEAALKALYNSFWKEKWFAGGFLWKWYDNPNAGGNSNTDYTPQNKPAEKLVKETYNKH